MATSVMYSSTTWLLHQAWAKHSPVLAKGRIAFIMWLAYLSLFLSIPPSLPPSLSISHCLHWGTFLCYCNNTGHLTRWYWKLRSTQDGREEHHELSGGCGPLSAPHMSPPSPLVRKYLAFCRTKVKQKALYDIMTLVCYTA